MLVSNSGVKVDDKGDLELVIHLGPKEQDVFHHRRIRKQSREALVQKWFLVMTFKLLR